MTSFIYISSNGEQKDVRQLDTQYLINALTKSYRNYFEVKNINILKNINNLQDELNRRIQKIIFEGDNK